MTKKKAKRDEPVFTIRPHTPAEIAFWSLVRHVHDGTPTTENPRSHAIRRKCLRCGKEFNGAKFKRICRKCHEKYVDRAPRLASMRDFPLPEVSDD